MKTVEYRAFLAAKRRCSNPKDKDYKYYGGRGVEFKFRSFLSFLFEIGYKPSPKLTLDRIKNDGHYEEGNVRWASRSEQNKNRRTNGRAGKFWDKCKRGHLFTPDNLVPREARLGRRRCRTCSNACARQHRKERREASGG